MAQDSRGWRTYFLGASWQARLAPEDRISEDWLLAPALHLAVTRLAEEWSDLVHSGLGTPETVCQPTRGKSIQFMTSSQSCKVSLLAISPL